MNAWLITWEGISSHVSDDHRVVAILSNRLSSSSVEDLADLCYQISHCSAAEMAHFANRKKERRRATRMLLSNGVRIFYGSDPFIYARRVTNVVVKKVRGDTTESIKWVERPLYKQNPKNKYSIELVEEAKAVEIFRRSDRPVGTSLVPNKSLGRTRGE